MPVSSPRRVARQMCLYVKYQPLDLPVHHVDGVLVTRINQTEKQSRFKTCFMRYICVQGYTILREHCMSFIF